MTSQTVRNTLLSALEVVRSGNLDEAELALQHALSCELGNEDVLYSLRAVKYWRDRFRQAKHRTSHFESGDFLVSQWKSFLEAMEKHGQAREVVIYSFKYAVFKQALVYYDGLGSANTENLAAWYHKIGICFKALGDYDEALKFLDYARAENGDTAPILAELADAHALCGNVRYAKVFFREAFFIAAAEVEIQFLESEMICNLINSLASETGYTGQLLLEWIPVHAVINNVFSIKRPLNALETGKLKQKIFSLETQIRSVLDSERRFLVPQLLNAYFWLIDYYVGIGEDKSRIDDVLLKIKYLDSAVYSAYVGT